MKYKIIATDLDGTLLNNNKKISNENIKAINYALSKGVMVIPCTGRAIQGITNFKFLSSLNCPAIAYNGGMIVNLKDNSIIRHSTLQQNDAKLIIRKGFEFDTNICIWIDNKLYCNKINDYTLNYSKISGVNPLKFDCFSDIRNKEITKILWYDINKNIENYFFFMSSYVLKSVTCCTSKPYFLEFFNSKTSKSLALEYICNMYNINSEKVIAIGDEMNDVSMIEFAGMGVAVENAKNDVKQKADFITSSNDEDGFAEMVYKFI